MFCYALQYVLLSDTVLFYVMLVGTIGGSCARAKERAAAAVVLRIASRQAPPRPFSRSYVAPFLFARA